MKLSWSRTRKLLEEDFLCESLRGRVKYFFTLYNKAHDQGGRFAIRVDGIEVLQANPYNERYYDEYTNIIREKENIPMREWNGKTFLHDEANLIIEDRGKEQAIQDGKIDCFDVVASVEEYINMKPDEALRSKNLILRLFAVLDRRVGKRTLQRLTESYKFLPEWLKFFYELRFLAEGFEVEGKSKLLLSSDGEVYLYAVDDFIFDELGDLIDDFDEVLNCNNYTEKDFVDYIKKIFGKFSIIYIKIVGVYPKLEDEYKDVYWYNF